MNFFAVFPLGLWLYRTLPKTPRSGDHGRSNRPKHHHTFALPVGPAK